MGLLLCFKCKKVNSSEEFLPRYFNHKNISSKAIFFSDKSSKCNKKIKTSSFFENTSQEVIHFLIKEKI